MATVNLTKKEVKLKIFIVNKHKMLYHKVLFNLKN